MTDIFDEKGNKLSETVSEMQENDKLFYFEPYKRFNITQSPTLLCCNIIKTEESKIYSITADKVAGTTTFNVNNNFHLVENSETYGTNTFTPYG